MENYPAAVTMHCPTGPVHSCYMHAAQIRGLMGFLGTHVGETDAPDGAQCANCVNEAKNVTPNDSNEGPAL